MAAFGIGMVARRRQRQKQDEDFGMTNLRGTSFVTKRTFAR
jgi:hypothetical protein